MLAASSALAVASAAPLGFLVVRDGPAAPTPAPADYTPSKHLGAMRHHPGPFYSPPPGVTLAVLPAEESSCKEMKLALTSLDVSPVVKLDYCTVRIFAVIPDNGSINLPTSVVEKHDLNASSRKIPLTRKFIKTYVLMASHTFSSFALQFGHPLTGHLSKARA